MEKIARILRRFPQLDKNDRRYLRATYAQLAHSERPAFKRRLPMLVQMLTRKETVDNPLGAQLVAY